MSRRRTVARTNKAKPQEVMEALANTWPDVQEHFRLQDDCCILASRAGAAALERFNVRAQPLSVAVRLYGTVERGSRATSAFIDPRVGETQPGKWNGHLVVLARRDKMLVDLTIPQLDNPLPGMEEPSWAGQLGPLVIGVPQMESFLEGAERVGSLSPSLRFAYRAEADDVSWQAQPDGLAPIDGLVQALVEGVRVTLAEQAKARSPGLA